MRIKTKARVTGALFLFYIVAGVIAEGFISDRLVAPGDAARTAANILGHESLYRAGFALYLVEMAGQIVTVMLFYELLAAVSKSLARISAALELAGCVIKAMSRLFYFAPLLALGGASYLSVFTAVQLQALALLFLRINAYGAGIALVFFGFSGLLQGYLIIKSTFLPRWLGVWAVIASVGWLSFLSPPLGLRLFPFVAAVGVLGALVTIGWLVIVGVDEQRWKEQAHGHSL
jgi:hypothetical protein